MRCPRLRGKQVFEAVKIVHVVRTLDPRTGGPASVLRGLAGAQAAAGHEVAVLFEDAQAERVAPIDGVQVINLAEPSGAKRVLAVEIGRLQPDIVHVHGVWCSLVRRTTRLARRRGLRYVLSPHGALGRWSLAQKAWKKRLALAFWYRPVLRAARALIASNERERQELVELGLTREAVLIPHGVSTAEATLASVPRSERPRILFLGRLAEVKDPLLLVEAFALVAAEHPEVELTIAGPDDGLGARLRARIEALPASVRTRIELPGPIYGSAKQEALRRAWVLCLPSRYESFGAVLIEALAQGTPVVCSLECGFPEIAQAGAGASVLRERDALAGALTTFLDRQRSDAAGARGRELVLARYLWPVQVARYDEVYERGAAGGRPLPQ